MSLNAARSAISATPRSLALIAGCYKGSAAILAPHIPRRAYNSSLSTSTGSVSSLEHGIPPSTDSSHKADSKSNATKSHSA